MDDAIVYFRDVDNLLFLDLGLVYNPSEYVEGYSSPLWTLPLIALRSIHRDYWLLVRLMGIVTFAATWACLVVVDRRLSPSSGDQIHFRFLAFPFILPASPGAGLTETEPSPPPEVPTRRVPKSQIQSEGG